MSYPGDRCTPGIGPHLPPPGVSSNLPAGILLTRTSTPIIVNSEPVMRSACKTRWFRLSTQWKSVPCIVLALLFLYNPYLVGPCASGSLNVEHPASHRATVGSSELQHFTAPDRVSDALTL